MKALRFVAAAGLAGAIALGGTVVAQAAPASNADLPTAAVAQQVRQVNRADEIFLKMGHQFGRYEILKSGMAVGKGHCFAVRRLASIEVRSHRLMDQKLRVVAARERVSLPGYLTPQMARTLRVLSGKVGRDFDRAWIQAQTIAHQHALYFVRQEIRSGDSPEVKQLAREALPILERHAALLRATQRTCFY